MCQTQIKNNKLSKKVADVSNYMEIHKLSDNHVTKGIRSAVSNKNDLLSIDTFNAYVHNRHFSPIPNNLKTTWDNIQLFIIQIWVNI
jgi:hypothetical protein